MIPRLEGKVSKSVHQRALWRASALSLAVLFVFAGTVGVWAVSATISGAVVAGGQVVVDSNVKKVQHQTGGVVAELRVREGQRVAIGDVVLRLDDTLARANLELISNQIDELASRRARLTAERDDLAEMQNPSELAERPRPALQALVAGERGLFTARRNAREGQRAQLAKRINQLSDEVRGLNAQQQAKAREAEIIKTELGGVRDLYAKNLVQLSRLSQLERDAASIAGQIGQLVASVAQAEGKIAETRLQMIQIDQELRSEAMKELREIAAKESELKERQIAARDQLGKLTVRAPAAGVVQDLAVHTVGGVLGAGETAMLIVPTAAPLTIDALVDPHDIDQIRAGQAVGIRLEAGSARSMPQLNGSVARVAADVSVQKETGRRFYTVNVGIPPGEIARLDSVELKAGMQAELFIRTEDRTPLEFLVKPLRDQIARAFRER